MSETPATAVATIAANAAFAAKDGEMPKPFLIKVSTAARYRRLSILW
jgi:hypothetical protein